jgi:hypothetical protein
MTLMIQIPSVYFNRAYTKINHAISIHYRPIPQRSSGAEREDSICQNKADKKLYLHKNHFSMLSSVFILAIITLNEEPFLC